jgi:hypothetical protein
MPGFASDIDAAEEGRGRSLPRSRQTTLSPGQQDQYADMANGPASSDTGCSSDMKKPPMDPDDPWCCCREERIDVDDFMEKHCQSRRSYDSAPPGWPRLAAMPHRIYNTDVLRSFNPVGQRLIQYSGSRLAYLEQMLMEHDQERNGRRDLTRYQKRLPGQFAVAEEYYDLLVGEIRKEYLVYTKLTRRYGDINQLHTVPRRRYRQILKYILNTVKLQKESLFWINALDEVLSFTRPPPRLLVWLSSTKVGRRILKVFETRRHCPTEGTRGFMRLDTMTMMHLGAITTFALALLIPTGILFLCTLTRAQAFAIVVVFTLIFSLQINPQDRHKALYAVCAWCAVLVTVMVQMAGVAPES